MISPASSLTTTTQYLKFQNFDLGRALQEDNNCRIEVEREGWTLENEHVEFEDVVGGGAEENTGGHLNLTNFTITSPLSNPSSSQLPSFPKRDSLPSTSPRASSKRSRKTSASRRKQATAASARDAAAEVKAHAIRTAQDSAPISLKAFDISNLPAGSNGWTGSPTSKLSPGLKKIWRNLKVLSTSSLQVLDWHGIYRGYASSDRRGFDAGYKTAGISSITSLRRAGMPGLGAPGGMPGLGAPGGVPGQVQASTLTGVGAPANNLNPNPGNADISSHLNPPSSSNAPIASSPATKPNDRLMPVKSSIISNLTWS